MNKTIYFLSGLGADERVFQYLELPNYTLKHIRWIEPTAFQESMEDYAKRLLEQIEGENPILLGLSFGGMMAMEIAKQIPTSKIILISSAKTKHEVPFYYRWLGKLRINRILPTSILMNVNIITYWFFDMKTKSEKDLLKAIVKDSSKNFYTWAVDKILHWKNTIIHQNLKHIHGTTDRILPLKLIKADKIIQKGGHLMTLNKSKEISKEILDFLQ
jgi:pimeloyl-ACP methyl ester carboxylesterase